MALIGSALLNSNNNSGDDIDEENDDDVLEFGAEDLPASNSYRVRRPWVTGSYVVVRLAPLALYLFCEWLALQFVLVFVLTTVLLAVDFWTVKNISGRLLVGLRWWNVVDTDGVSHWVFENGARRQRLANSSSATPPAAAAAAAAASGGNISSSLPSASSSAISPSSTTAAGADGGGYYKGRASPLERRIFWSALLLCPLLWLLLALSSIIGFHYIYLVLPVMAVTLSGANLYGFVRCRFGAASAAAESGAAGTSLAQWLTVRVARDQMRRVWSTVWGRGQQQRGRQAPVAKQQQQQQQLILSA